MTEAQHQVIDVESVEVGQSASSRSDEDKLLEAEDTDTAKLFIATLEEMIYSSSVTEACEASGMAERTFHRVKNRSNAAWQLYTRARRSRADYRFDNLITKVEGIADPQKARVILEAEKWTIGKMNRLLYGDDPPVTNVQVNNIDHSHAAIAAVEERLAKRAKQLARLGGGTLGSEEKGGDLDIPPLTIPSPT